MKHIPHLLAWSALDLLVVAVAIHDHLHAFEAMRTR